MSVNDTPRIVTYNSRAILQIIAPPTDDSRGVIYNHNMFIARDTGFSF